MPGVSMKKNKNFLRPRLIFNHETIEALTSLGLGFGLANDMSLKNGTTTTTFFIVHNLIFT